MLINWKFCNTRSSKCIRLNDFHLSVHGKIKMAAAAKIQFSHYIFMFKCCYISIPWNKLTLYTKSTDLVDQWLSCCPNDWKVVSSTPKSNKLLLLGP